MSPTIIRGLKKVIIMNDLFLTLFKNSRFVINDKWFMLVVLYSLDKDVVCAWNYFNEMG